ncbi:MAG: Mrp/NBP35 family ATP-binding protein [bacterium]
MMTEAEILKRLHTVSYPGFSRDIVSFGLVKSIRLKEEGVEVVLGVTTPDASIPEKIKTAVEDALKDCPQAVVVRMEVSSPKTSDAPQPAPLAGTEHVIAIASGKGGVGKSTVAANLAVAMARLGKRVGLCDCDIYGPSLGVMFHAVEQPATTGEGKVLPLESHGLKLMSLGFLIPEDSPIALRGPIATRYTQQLLLNVEWGELDVLILDLPPGTGDVQLTIVQTVKLSGAILVTTPQEVALAEVRRAAAMFQRADTPLLGVVENMSYFSCPSDGKRYEIFGSGGGKREAERLGVPLLGEIPLDEVVRLAGDDGEPIVAKEFQSSVSQEFVKAANKILSLLPFHQRSGQNRDCILKC